jgi:hypothetical protein
MILLPANNSSKKYRTMLRNPRIEQPYAHVQQQVSHKVYEGNAGAAGITSSSM